MSGTRGQREGAIYQLKVTLKGSKPPIWRRLQVPGEVTLAKLHQVLQAAMGWTDSHLHQFEVDGVYYGPPELRDELDVESEQRLRLRQAAPDERAKFRYEYDFGDDWQHEILVEKIAPPEPGRRYPICLAGKRACPPEDCGGIWGYYQLLETVGNPDDPEHDELREWLGGDFDPEDLDLDEINQSLKRIRV